MLDLEDNATQGSPRNALNEPPPYDVVETRGDNCDLTQRGIRLPSSICAVTWGLKDISQMDHATDAPIPLHKDGQAFTPEEMCHIPLQYAIHCHSQLNVWASPEDVSSGTA